jgi:hypothetical protein
MNTPPLLLVGLLASFAHVHAQVSAGLVLSQDQFMPGESIPVAVRITNFSGQTLKLGQNNSWLRFNLDRKDGPPALAISDLPLQGEFELTTSTIATKRADLAPHYENLRPGRYTLSANVRLEEWGRVLQTPVVEFDVIQGTVLWEQPFGLPTPPGSTTPPEIRRYALQQALHLKQVKLYARVTDGSGTRTYRVFPLGPMLTFSTPEKQIDRQSRLHVLYQYGARSFYYLVVDPDGQLLVRQTHDYAGASRPILALSPAGDLEVRGGVRRPAPDDFPPPAPPSEPESPPAVPDPATP